MVDSQFINNLSYTYKKTRSPVKIDTGLFFIAGIIMITPLDKLQEIGLAFIDAFTSLNQNQLASFLDEGVVAHVTNARAGVDIVSGRQSLVDRFRLMDIKKAGLELTVTQIVTISATQIMLMVEVNAFMDDKSLHNFAAHLLTIKNSKIVEMWMVEALPAYSDEFWLASSSK